MKPISLKQWFLLSFPALLMGIGVGLCISGNPYSLYFFFGGVILEIPILWLVYKHK